MLPTAVITVELLIARHADVNARNAKGLSALNGAVWKAHREVVECLISHGADVDAVDNQGATALHRAVGYGHRQIVELLIASGADVNARMARMTNV